MSRGSQIRWRESDKSQLRKAVRNYNDKINRIVKKDPTLAGLMPARVKVSDLSAGINTRAEYNQWMKRLTSFTKRGGEKQYYPENFVKWNKREDTRLKNAVKKFNDKIDRLAKENRRDAHILPPKMHVRDLKKTIQTKNDLDVRVKQLRAFLKKGAETVITLTDNSNNLKVTEWQYDIMSGMKDRINAARSERMEFLNQLDVTRNGIELGYKVGMGPVEMNELLPTDVYTRSTDRTGLNMRLMSQMRQDMENYFLNNDYAVRERYIEQIIINFGYNDMKDVIQGMREMDIEDWFQEYRSHGNSFEDVYPDKDKVEQYATSLRATWGMSK